MTGLASVLAVGVVVFVSTNVDDLVVLAALFADPELRARSIVIGQVLGIGALVAASTVAAATALVVPVGWPALLGAVPLTLGVSKLWKLRSRGRADPGDGREAAVPRGRSQVLAVAAVTVANGGDNLASYIPLFARDLTAVPVYALVFAVMTALWCFAGHRLVHDPVFGRHLRRHGQVLLPLVLVALGVWLLAGARVLLP